MTPRLREELAALCDEVEAEVLFDEPMSAHTTIKIGGACEALINLPNIAACKACRKFLVKNGIPSRLIGRGSNLLVPDEGFEGVALTLGGMLAADIRAEDSGLIRCGAGVPLNKLCLAAREHALSGLEFAFGIPGSVGGAVYMNAGAYGGEISQVLVSATVLDEEGKTMVLSGDELAFSYRHSLLMERPLWILGARFALKPGNRDEIRETMRALLQKRSDKQPLEYPSAGSTFKRPQGGYASALIDSCGLRGLRVGDAQVSEKHAGFVINLGHATFADVMTLCEKIQREVFEQTGFRLELEPEILRAERQV